MKTLPLLAGLCLLLPAAYAQETTASGVLNQEASWQALQNRISATNGNVTVLRTDVNALLKCGKQKKMYAPDETGTYGCQPVFDPQELEIKTGVVTLGRNVCGKGADSCYVDKATVEYLCKKAGYSYATGISVSGFDSPGNNTCGRWTGKKWEVFGAKKDNRHLSALTCQTIKWK